MAQQAHTEPEEPIAVVKAQLFLNDANAYALAELCKRIGWSSCRSISLNDEECHRMLSALCCVREALASAGVHVR